jgi:hypothetical protein
VLELLLEADARGHVVEDEDGAAALAGSHLEGGHGHVDHEVAAVGRGQAQLVDVADLVFARAAEDQAAAQRVQEGGGEDVVQGAAQDLLSPPARQQLQRAVPARHVAVQVEDQDPRVDALQDVHVVLGELLQLVGLLAQAAVQPAVHEGGGGLAGQGLEQVHLLAVEAVQPRLAPDAQDRDRLALHPAGEVVGEVERTHLGQGLGIGLRVQRLAPRQAGHERAVRGHAHEVGRGRAAARAEDREAAVVLRKEDGQGLHAQRGPHALEQPLRHAGQVQVGVEVLGEPQHGPARLVALAEEQAIDALLDPALHRREEQDHEQGRDHGHDRHVRLLVAAHDHLEQVQGQEADPHDGGGGQRVDEGAPEDELHVHEPVLHHRVGQGERDQGQRDVPGQLHAHARLAAQREGDRVEQEERQDARARAPDQPLHLLPRGEAAGLAIGVQQDPEGQRETARRSRSASSGRWRT